MTKKELKDIILKTLEKEGGAAGLKALTKASKTSKGKLKKSLAKMTGVKQHQDGDYISTPINEVETIGGISLGSSEGCFCGCPPGYDTPFGTGSVAYGAGGQGCPGACSACCAKLVDMCSPSGGTTETGGEYFDTKDNTIAVIGPDSRMPGFREPRKPMPRKPMRLREAEEYVGIHSGAGIFCSKCPCGCSDVITDYQPAGGGNATYAKCKEDCTGQDATSVAAKMVDPRYRKPMRIREVKEIIEVMLDEKKKKKKDRCHRKADSVYGTKTSAYKSGAIVKCRKGMIWKVGSKKKK